MKNVIRTGTLLLYLWIGTPVGLCAVIPAGPGDYNDKIDQLQPGDTLQLAPGVYTRLDVSDLHGEPDGRITIAGPESGDPAVIVGESCCNTVQIRRCSYLTIKNLHVDSLDLGVDGINAKDGISHDIVIENNTIVGVGDDQQTVGIGTKSEAWNWVIRNNTILEAGTGIYLGDSTGAAPFIAGIVEGNFILNPTGYCMEIKHQNSYILPEAPPGPNVTIIRNNVFIKDDRPPQYGARPSLLVDGFPDSGQGSSDRYEIYGNFIHHNPYEALIQASGRVAIHDNVLTDAGDGETAIYLGDHNRPLKQAYVYNNTIYTPYRGIRMGNAAREDHQVMGNVVFAAEPISGQVTNTSQNVTDTVENAGNYVEQPSSLLGEMDFYPDAGQCQGPELGYPAELLLHRHYDQDFNGAPKGEFTFRGAYAGEGVNPGWQLSASRKEGGPGSVADQTPPTPPTGVDAVALNSISIRVTWSPASDQESGISRYKIYRDAAYVSQTTVAEFSDDGLHESTPYSYRVSAVNGAGLESDLSPAVVETTLPDTTPPSLVAASAAGDPTAVTVTFDEPVEPSSATNASNYTIDHGVSVQNAAISADGTRVTLRTSTHVDGVLYTLMVDNVRDLASIPNTISADSQVSYSFLTELVISSLTATSGRSYEVAAALGAGSSAYTDRDYLYQQIPAALVGSAYIKTANDDKLSQGGSFLSFDVNQGVVVYIAHSNSYTIKPVWLQSWDATGLSAQIHASFALFSKEFPTGPVVLGGNVNPADAAEHSMYTVIVVPTGDLHPPQPPAAPAGLEAR